jgi:hypothetical protein
LSGACTFKKKKRLPIGLLGTVNGTKGFYQQKQRDLLGCVFEKYTVDRQLNVNMLIVK